MKGTSRAKQFPSSSAISALISKDSISVKKRSIGFGVSRCASFYVPPLINQVPSLFFLSLSQYHASPLMKLYDALHLSELFSRFGGADTR